MTTVTIGASGLFYSSCKGANNKVVLALVGAGNWGVNTITSACRDNIDVEIKTVCDVNDNRSSKAVLEIEKQLGYKPGVTRDMMEVFDDKDVDAAWITTPDHWHALATIWACQAGKHVYVEKTPSNSIWEGRQMVEAAKRYRRVVQVGFQNRSAAYNHSAREYIQSGKLGQVVHVKIYNLLGGKKWEPKPDQDVPPGLDWDAWLGPAPYIPYNPGIHNGWGNYWAYGPGTLNDASHQIDLARMVMGDPGHPLSIFGWGGNHVWGSKRETPEFQACTFDYGKYSITCESGNLTSYMAKTNNEIRMDPTRFPVWELNSTRIELYGTEGFMYLGRMGGGWQVYGPGEEIVAQEGGVYPNKEHHANFIESIRTRISPNSGIEQAHMSASLVHMANIAYRTGNKQLIFDGSNERFIDNDEANKFIKPPYRDNYKVPERV